MFLLHLFAVLWQGREKVYSSVNCFANLVEKQCIRTILIITSPLSWWNMLQIMPLQPPGSGIPNQMQFLNTLERQPHREHTGLSKVHIKCRRVEAMRCLVRHTAANQIFRLSLSLPNPQLSLFIFTVDHLNWRVSTFYHSCLHSARQSLKAWGKLGGISFF